MSEKNSFTQETLAKKMGLRIRELERLYGIEHGGNRGNQYVPSSNNCNLAKSQEVLAKEIGISIPTLQNYKLLSDMIPDKIIHHLQFDVLYLLYKTGKGYGMNYNVYIDESGNTGNIELNEDLTWNFQGQSHFALGAIYIDKEKCKDLELSVSKILQKYNPKLGNEHELKSKANYKFKNDLLKDLTELLLANKVQFYFDVADKKFKSIMNMVEYCVHPNYLYDFASFIRSRDERIDSANFLYKTLPDEHIKTFIDICQEPLEEDTENRFIDFLNILRVHYISQKYDSGIIEDVIGAVMNRKNQYNLSLEELLPVKDFNNKGTGESFLPNVDAFNNLLLQIGREVSYGDKLYIYHDKQTQFSKVLSKWSDVLKERSIIIEHLDFYNSKEQLLIQVADFYTGTFLRLYKEIISSTSLNRNNRELMKILKPVFINCNIVASRYEQLCFFERCGLEYTATPLPF